MTVPEQTGGLDWDAFEALVASHKVAVARVMRVEDQLIDLIRAHKRKPPPDIAARYGAALDEARSRARATGTALFPPADYPGGGAPAPAGGVGSGPGRPSAPAG